jgi:hypothetical protein
VCSVGRSSAPAANHPRHDSHPYFDATVRGKVLRGRVQFSYSYSDNGGGYCYQSSDARVVARSVFTRTLPTLNGIAAFTYYRGPGVCIPTLLDLRKC